jgi:hypothetical protein
MPNIIPYHQRTQTPVADLSATSSAAARSKPVDVSGLAEGAMDVSKILFEREEEQGRAWAAEALSNARLEWTSNLFERQASADLGAENFSASIISDFDAYSSKLVEKAPGPKAKEYMQTRLADIRTMIGEKALAFESESRVDYRDQKFSKAIDNAQKLMNADPGQYEIALAETMAVIDASFMPPNKRRVMMDKAIKGISTAALWAQVNKSPSEFLNSIGMGTRAAGAIGGKLPGGGLVEGVPPQSPQSGLMGRTGNKAFDMMEFDDRVAFVSKAIGLKASLDADADRIAERERKAIGEEAMKEAFSRMYPASGGQVLTRDYIESIRPAITDSEYKTLLEGVRQVGSSVKSDPASFRQVQKLLYDDPDQARVMAMRFHSNGLLDNTDLSAALTKANELDRQGGPKTEYERTRQRIVGNLDPGPFVQDPIGRGRLAEALYAFDKWVEKNPKATDEQIAKRGHELTNQHKFINMSDTAISLPLPRFGTIRRNVADPNGMQQDIANAFAAAKKALAEKKITKEEYLEEASLLNKWLKLTGGK